MRLKHLPGPNCNSCNLKLIGAHAEIRKWFLENVKPLFPDTHVSCAWRDFKKQKEYFDNGQSKARPGQSKHNFLDQYGEPCARALDLFKLSAEGKAEFPAEYYEEIARKCHDEKIKWGGEFQSISDGTHFELV